MPAAIHLSPSRRQFIGGIGAAIVVTTASTSASAVQPAMARVIIDNDFSGDPDGLFQLAQHALSPSIDIPLIVGSHLPADTPWSPSKTTATDARAKALELLTVMGREKQYRVLAGSELAIPTRTGWKSSPAAAAIIAEALRTDRSEQLVYAAGAGLTDLALAWLERPEIGKRIRLIWIGGAEHPSLAYPPPNADALEFNFSIDPLAAQIVFNESDIEIWQVPRNVYRQMLFSSAELTELGNSGRIGRYLKREIDQLAELIAKIPQAANFPRSETYILGDSPLVTLTSLQSFFQPDPSSSAYRLMPTPRMTLSGQYEPNPNGRPMRVFTQIDTRLTFSDMLSKFRLAEVQAPHGRANR